ncbi:MAG: phospholipid carrier-dependent glycosyltransferase [Burkholderiales bacterium]|nr:phospholipid carrier-dependent glycosyltransferase [Burkholderiales bacterium]
MSVPRAVLVLLALLALFVGVDNMQRPLAHPDEGRYSEISREMAASGDWVTPRLNGIKYFEKPPLQYWASAAAFRLFGENAFTARIYTALAGLLALAAVGFTARRLAGTDAALLAVGVLLSSPYFLGMGGVVTLDMGLTAWTTVAVCAFLLAAAGPPGERRRWMLVAWAGMALAVLSKGLIGIVFPAAAVFLHCLVHRDWRLLARLEWARGAALFLAITVPWFVLVSAANPEFPRFFFVHEHFERFLTKTHRREEPWWYFWPILFAGFLPWMLALVPAAVEGWRREAAAAGFPWRRFALLWSGFILLFFSASGSKLPAYILPVFPVFALVLGDWLARAEPRRLWKMVAIVVPLLVVAIALAWGAPERARNAWTRELYAAARPWILSGLAVLAVALAAAALRLRAGRKAGALAAIVAASLLFIDFVEDGYERLAPRQSGFQVAETIRREAPPEARVYSVGLYDQTVPFYLGRTVTLVAYVDEFEMGLRLEPGRAIPTLEAFAADWVRPGSAVAIIHPDTYETLSTRGLAMTLLHRDERRILVRKP